MEATPEARCVLVRIAQAVIIVSIVFFWYTLETRSQFKALVLCVKSVSVPKLAQRQLVSCVFEFFCKIQQIRIQGLNRRLYTLLTHTMYYVYIPKDFYYSRGVPFPSSETPTGCSEKVRALYRQVTQYSGKLEWQGK